MVAALLGALRVVRVEVRLRLHLRHRGVLLLDHGRDVDEGRRHEVAELGLVRLEEEQLRRLDGLERARDAGAGGERASLLDGEERGGVVGVERVAVRVRDRRRRERTRGCGRRSRRARRCRPRAGSRRGRGTRTRRRARPPRAPPLRAGSPSRARRSGPAPSRARPTPRARRTRARARGPSRRPRSSTAIDAARAPDEVGGVRADHEELARHRPPASLRDCPTIISRDLVLVEPGLRADGPPTARARPRRAGSPGCRSRSRRASARHRLRARRRRRAPTSSCR